MFKWIKWSVIGMAVLGVAGVVCFGRSLPSYIKSSGNMLTSAVKDAIPIEFEIQRARDALDALVPEMHANLRLVAAEEVDVANLEKEVSRQRESVADETAKVQKLRGNLDAKLASFELGGHDYKRTEVVEELSRRFERLRTAEMLLQGKEDLLKNRKRSLDAALQKLEKTRLARLELASQIEALEGQFRLMQAQASGTEFHLDDSKLAQSQRIIADLKKRLEVAQHVLAREAQFVETIPVERADESTVVEKVDAYFSKKGPCPASDARAALAAEAKL